MNLKNLLPQTHFYHIPILQSTRFTTSQPGSDILQLNQQDVNLSINSFLNKVNSIFDEHAPLKCVNNKYKLKFKSKPWITPAIQKSITIY